MVHVQVLKTGARLLNVVAGEQSRKRIGGGPLIGQLRSTTEKRPFN